MVQPSAHRLTHRRKWERECAKKWCLSPHPERAVGQRPNPPARTRKAEGARAHPPRGRSVEKGLEGRRICGVERKTTPSAERGPEGRRIRDGEGQPTPSVERGPEGRRICAGEGEARLSSERGPEGRQIRAACSPA